MKYPFDDEIMKYDYEGHRYVLDANGVLAAIGINLDTALNAAADRNAFTVRNFLEEITDSVYEYIYEDSSNAEFLEWQLAINPGLRPIVKKMLLAQVKYTLDNNFTDAFSGVNIVKGTAMKLRDLRGAARIAPRVERLCRQDLVGFPFTLKTALMLPCVPACLYRKGY